MNKPTSFRKAQWKKRERKVSRLAPALFADKHMHQTASDAFIITPMFKPLEGGQRLIIFFIALSYPRPSAGVSMLINK